MQGSLITASIFLASFSTVCSIKCYHCLPGVTDGCSSFTLKQCVRNQIVLDCPKGMNVCMHLRLTGEHEGAKIDVERRSCASTWTCGSLRETCRHHQNVTDLHCEYSCCNRDRCNGSAGLAACELIAVLLCSLLVYVFVGNL